MSRWKSVKAKQLLAALLRIGWEVAWQKGSHSFTFHVNEEVGPTLLPLPQISKKTGFQPEDL
jgi:predicted RNA binding protein YcfA (HicA-like mRNA interferase family)